MSLYLSKMIIKNIQSHEHSVFDFPEKGVVRFLGRNSHGKSVGFKVLGDVLKNKLHIKKERLPLIRRGCISGSLTLLRSDGLMLEAMLTREPSGTYVRLYKENELDIRRYVTTDKNTSELVSIFGFHYVENREFSLNLYETYDPLLLFTTPAPFNDDVVNSVLVDSNAQHAIEQMEIKAKMLKETRAQIITHIDKSQAVLASMDFCDEESVFKDSQKLRYLTNSIELLSTPAIPDLPFIPNTEAITLLESQSARTKLKDVEEYANIQLSISTIDLLKTLNDNNLDNMLEEHSTITNKYETYNNGECYACRRKFNECHHTI